MCKVQVHVTDRYAAFYIRQWITNANVAKIKRLRIKDGLHYLEQ